MVGPAADGAASPTLGDGCGRACGMARHGTYERKTPVVMPVDRCCCPGCRTTFSLLPDFAAARRPGSLQEIEDGMAVLAGSRGPWAFNDPHLSM